MNWLCAIGLHKWAYRQVYRILPYYYTGINMCPTWSCCERCGAERDENKLPVEGRYEKYDVNHYRSSPNRSDGDT